MSQAIRKLVYTADQIEGAVTRVCDIQPCKIGYNGVGKYIYIAYPLEEKPTPHQAERISNALMQLTEHLTDRVEEFEEDEDYVIAIYQQKEYPLILQIT